MQSEMDERHEQSMTNLLMQDALAAIRRHAEAGDQASRRDLIRTLFSASEGLVWIFREHVSSVARQMDELEKAEATALAEVVYAVGEDGRINAQRRYVSISAAVRLCVRIACRLDKTLNIRFDESGWQDFRVFVERRNRLSHPKSQDDLLVTEAEAARCLAAFHWLVEICVSAMEATHQAGLAYRTEMRQIACLLRAGDPETIELYRIAAERLRDD